MAQAQKGIDVRQTGTSIVFRTFLQTSAGALLGTGTTVLSIVELQSDGTIKSYDFNDNTFKTTALTTPTLAMTHRPSNNAATTTGFWTVALATVTGFTVGGIYQVIVNNSGASPTDQMREFQYGGEQGDLLVTAGTTGQAYLQTDTEKWLAGTIPAVNVTGVPIVDAKYFLGTVFANPATAGIPDINVKNINNAVAATPGAAGGLFIAGSNAATTISGLTTGALACTTITASGAVAFQSTFAVTTSTNLAALSCSTLTASGAVAFQSTFATTGTTTLNALTVTNNFTVAGSCVLTLAKTTNITGFNDISAAAAATGVWQDATAGDFTVVSSIGKSLYTSGNVPGAASGLALVGSAMGAVSSVTGNVGGNVTGSVGSVVAGVTVTTNNDKTGYSLTVTPPTAAVIATAIWTDTTAGDFTTLTSPGKIIFAQLGGAFTTTSSSVFTVAALANAPTGGTAPTVGQIATAVWQDATAGDFTVSGSIGKSLFTSGNAPGAASGLALVGSNVGAAASVTAGVTISTNNDKTGYSLTQAFPTNFAALGISVGGHISNVDTLATYTGNTPQTGDSFALIGATGSGLTSLAPASTALSTANWTNARAGYLDNLNIGGAVASHTDATAISSQVGSPQQVGTKYAVSLAAGDVSGNLPVIVNTYGSGQDPFHQVMRTALVESYAANGAPPTLEQATFAVQQNLCEFSIVGTTITVKKIDRTTAAQTFALDSATNPTARTRSS